MQDPVPTPPLGQRIPAWLVLLGSLTALGPLSVDMYLPGFPAMADSLGSTVADVQLTLAIYLVGMSLGQLVYGPLSDRFGRKPPLYAGLVVYTLASVGCAMAGDVVQLALWRFLQALGGSAAVVISRAVVRDRTTARDAARAFSLLMLVMGLAPILAPLLGGGLVVVSGWRSIFWLLAIAGLALLFAVRLGLRETVSRAETAPLRPSQIMRSYGALLIHRQFIAYTLCGTLAFAGMFAYIVASPYVLIELYGVPAQHFGWLFGLNALGLIAASQLNARLLRQLTPQAILACSLWIPPLAGVLMFGLVLAGMASLLWLMIGLFVFIASLGFIMPNSTALALAQVPRSAAGSAAAVLGTLQFLLGTLAGVAVSLWQMPSAMPLVGVMLLGGAGALALYQAVDQHREGLVADDG